MSFSQKEKGKLKRNRELLRNNSTNQKKKKLDCKCNQWKKYHVVLSFIVMMAAESQQHNYVFWEVQTDLHSCWTLFVYSTIHFMCLMLFWHDLITIVTNMHFWNVCVYYIYYTMYYNYLLQHNFVTGKKFSWCQKSTDVRCRLQNQPMGVWSSMELEI